MKSTFPGVWPNHCFCPAHLQVNRWGYHIITNGKGGKSSAHRIAYRLFCGPIPRGAMVLHACGNAACVNPYHLYLGSAAQNALDRERHGKTARGFGLPQTKLSAADVLAIRSSTKRVTDLAREFGVSKGHISGIRSQRVRPLLKQASTDAREVGRAGQ